jgi:hypothetical protein
VIDLDAAGAADRPAYAAAGGSQLSNVLRHWQPLRLLALAKALEP